MNRPASSSAAAKVGAVVSGPLQASAMQGEIGVFDPEATGAMFDPVEIVPKNVKLTAADDSDSMHDRLIAGGGQDGYRKQAYYRE
ncbi:hypothetical protein [Levilactobacillus brevis]|uniref:hypothetical protein n=1 Tax=Levilactobacillus brevis TaxID=1580 RepID=UPI001071095D|nr:hypothetical protein [Levilactobacillus brevis]